MDQGLIIRGVASDEGTSLLTECVYRFFFSFCPYIVHVINSGTDYSLVTAHIDQKFFL